MKNNTVSTHQGLLRLCIFGKDTIDNEDVDNVVLLQAVGKFSICYLLLQNIFTYRFSWYRAPYSCISVPTTWWWFLFCLWSWYHWSSQIDPWVTWFHNEIGWYQTLDQPLWALLCYEEGQDKFFQVQNTLTKHLRNEQNHQYPQTQENKDFSWILIISFLLSSITFYPTYTNTYTCRSIDSWHLKIVAWSVWSKIKLSDKVKMK